MAIPVLLQRRLWRRFSWALLFAAALAGCQDQGGGIEAADTVLLNGRIYTVNPDNPWAEAVAIRDGVISFVGASKDAGNHVGENTRVVDLAGKMLLPGFQDAHVHPVASGVTYQQCSLFGIQGVEALQARVQQCAKDQPEGWILGGGWLVDNFAPSGVPDKTLLDVLVPDRPVVLESSDGHSLWVNSRALKVAGITRDTPDPPGGRIDRYPGTTIPRGGLQEPSAMSLVLDHAPPPGPELLLDGLRYARDYLHSVGVTAVQDASVKLTPGDAYYGFDAYHSLDERGELKLRVAAAMTWDESKSLAQQLPAFEQARREQSRGNISARTVKIFQDGVIETETAALIEPYLGRRDDYRGALLNDPAVLEEAVASLDAAGFQLHFHAIGDRAIRSVLDAIEFAQAENGERDARHHVSHLELFDPADIPRFSALGVTANFQPLWAVRDNYITELTLPRIGQARGRWLYPIGSLQRSGARIAFGSDWSVSSANPLEGIEVALTRLQPSGATQEPLGEHEAITLEEAIAAYTINAAYVNFLDDRTGSIETGKLADLVVLDRDLFSIPPAQISEARILATLFGGRVVYGSL